MGTSNRASPSTSHISQLLSMITASPTAPLGSVTTLLSYSPSNFLPSDAILCRNTAPLITLAFGFIQREVGVHVLGREIGQGLVMLIHACKTDDITELEMKLITRRNREVAKARAVGSESAVAAIEDKYDCLNIFLQNANSIEELCSAIMVLFDDKAHGLLTLSTIHKAKGLEWDRTFRLDFKTLLPSKWATQPWQQDQERNLQYVCSTRAKLHIIDITSNCWRKEGDVICAKKDCATATVPQDMSAMTVQSTVSNPPVASNPPPTFDPDAVDDFKNKQAEKFQSDRLSPPVPAESHPAPSLSCDPSADSAWLAEQIYDSERAVAKGNAQHDISHRPQ